MENQSRIPLHNPFDTPPQSPGKPFDNPFDTPPQSPRKPFDNPFKTPSRSSRSTFKTPFDTPPEPTLGVPYRTARESSSLGPFSLVKVAGAMHSDSPPLVMAKQLDNPFETPSPGYANTMSGRRNPTPGPQAPSQEDLLDKIDELLYEYAQIVPPHRRRCYRRLPRELYDYARVSLKTGEDYAEYASRKRILFEETDGHPSSPILGAVDGRTAEANSDDHRVAEGKSEWWEEDLVSLIALLEELR